VHPLPHVYTLHVYMNYNVTKMKRGPAEVEADSGGTGRRAQTSDALLDPCALLRSTAISFGVCCMLHAALANAAMHA
jgi:hypothetical protein